MTMFNVVMCWLDFNALVLIGSLCSSPSSAWNLARNRLAPESGTSRSNLQTGCL
jgi:hypothetical protein